MKHFPGYYYSGDSIMETKTKTLIVLLLAITFFAGCQEKNKLVDGNNELVENVEKENKKESVNQIKNTKAQKLDTQETDSMSAQKLAQVPGATIGSLSSLVEDRGLWNDFVDEEFLDSVKKYGRGIHLPKILLDSDDAKGGE